MKLIVISSPDNIAHEAKIVNDLFGEKMEYFHLRKPGNTVDMTRQFLDLIKPEFTTKISLHQHHSLAKDYGVDRLHFTEERRRGISSMDLEKLKSDGFILSTSVHDVQSLTALSGIFEYTFLSPVFDSISKEGYRGIFNANFNLKEANLLTSTIALGGIKLQNYNILLNNGFGGIGILGYLWNRPENAVREFKALKDDIDKIYRH